MKPICLRFQLARYRSIADGVAPWLYWVCKQIYQVMSKAIRNLLPKSVKLYWTEKNLSGGDVLAILFGDRKETLKAAKLAVDRMKQTNTLSMTKREMRFFAKELQTGKLGEV